MESPAARVTDAHACPVHGGGPILPAGATSVLIGGLPAARVTDLCTCVGPPDVIAAGSTSVLIGGLPAARMGDQSAHGGVIIGGCPTVLIGTTFSGGPSGTDVAPPGTELLWGQTMRDCAPKPDSAVAAHELEAYVQRQQEIKAAYDQVQRGQAAHPHANRERLKQALEGDLDGTRVPLTFKDREQYEEFRRELEEALRRGGVSDAVVQQVGSATTGYKGNPGKPFGPWRPPTPEDPGSDADFAIFSEQALRQAMDNGTPVNINIVQNGQYTVFKNELRHTNRGFYQTHVGTELEALSRRWNAKIYGDEDADGFDFKLNSTTERFAGAITTLRMIR